MFKIQIRLIHTGISSVITQIKSKAGTMKFKVGSMMSTEKLMEFTDITIKSKEIITLLLDQRIKFMELEM